MCLSILVVEFCFWPVVAFVPQYPKSYNGRVVLYGELLYTCNAMVCVFVLSVFDR